MGRRSLRNGDCQKSADKYDNEQWFISLTDKIRCTKGLHDSAIISYQLIRKLTWRGSQKKNSYHHLSGSNIFFFHTQLCHSNGEHPIILVAKSAEGKGGGIGNLLKYPNKMSNFWMLYCVGGLRAESSERMDTNMGTSDIKWKIGGVGDRESGWKEVCEGNGVGLGVFRNFGAAALCV